MKLTEYIAITLNEKTCLSVCRRQCPTERGMLRALAFETWLRKIENHPDRHALQQDLRQNKAYNPFSAESKRMIQDVGNVELAV